MFEQTLIEAKASDKKRYTVLLSLLLQVSALATLIIVPLVYTQVLPKAELKSVFAAPTPLLPAPPKVPSTVRIASSRPSFQITPAGPIARRPRNEMPDLVAPTVMADAGPGGDPYSTGDSPSLLAINPPDLPAPVTKPSNKPVRIASMEASQLIHKVQPAYPQTARATRIQGVVEFTATIGKNGSIEHLQLVRGHPMLVKAAEEAILQWKYKPTILNGEPVEVITDIIVKFTLTQ